MTEHTPAPWHVTEAHGPNGKLCFYEVRNDDRETLFATWPASRGEPDARVAALAPELLDFAKNVAGLDDRLLTDVNILKQWRDDARALLLRAKLEGRAP